MIQEIFITDLACNVLYGNPRMFPSTMDARKAKSGELGCSYPVESVGDRRLSRLKVNDVILSILYVDTDNFTASKFLVDLKNLIEGQISRIDCRSVKKNYFTLLELLQNAGMVFPSPIRSTADPSRRENVYIDVVENIHTVIGENGEILKNCVHGEILSDGSDFRLLLEKCDAEFKAFLEETRGGTEILCKNDPQINFTVRSYAKVLFRMIRQGPIYTLESEFKGQFKYIEVAIPVGKSSYSAKIKQSTGSSDFDMKSGVVRWLVSHQSFTKETIKIHTMRLEEEIDTRSIMITFKIEDPEETSITIRGCRGTDGSGHRFWARYTIQSGHYEFRQ